MNGDTIFSVPFDNGEYKICLPDAKTDYIQGLIAKNHKPYELEMLNDMRARIKPGDVVVDVGANIGNHSLYLAACGARIVSIEPNEALTAAISISAELNGWSDRVSVFAIGAGSSDGFASLASEDSSNLGGTKLQIGVGEIPVRTLDSLLSDLNPSMIKIDVEGMEMDVLRGAEQVISRSRPLLYVESLTQEEFRAVYEWFAQRSYVLWDAFNASPTHLFVPSEYTDQDYSFSRVLFKEVERAYFLNGSLTDARQKLNEANLKYRSATQQIAEYKQRIAQEQEARAIGDAAVAELQQQLAQAEQALRQARADLVEAGESSGRESTSDSDALARLEAELESLQKRLTVAQDEARRGAELLQAEQARLAEARMAREAAERAIAELTAQLDAATTQLAAAEQRMEAERQVRRTEIERLEASFEAQQQLRQEAEIRIARLEAERQALGDRLVDAQEAHRRSVEQMREDQVHFVEAKVARQAAEQNISRLAAQLEVATAQLAAAEQCIESERQARLEEAERLETSFGAQRESWHEAETRLARLEAERQALQERLDEAREAHRRGTELLQAEQAQLAAAKSAREAAQQAIADLTAQFEATAAQLKAAELRLESERRALLDENVRLETSFETQREARHDAEVRLARLEAERQSLQERLAESRDAHQRGTELLQAEQAQLAEAKTAREAAQQAIADLTAQFEAAAAELTATEQRLESERRSLQDEIARLETSFEAQREARHDAELRLARLEAERQSLQERLVEAKEAHLRGVELLQAEQAKFAEATTAREAAQQAIADLTAQFDAVTAQLAVAEQRIESEQQARLSDVERLEASYEAQSSLRQEAEARLAQLEAERQDLQSRLTDAHETHRRSVALLEAEQAQLAETKLAREAAEQAVADLTAQLGITEQVSAYLKAQLAAAEQESESERQARRLEVERMEALLEAQRESRHEAESSLLRLQAEQAALVVRLEEVDSRNRLANERIALLKQRLQEAEASAQAQAQELASLQDRLKVADRERTRLLIEQQEFEARHKEEFTSHSRQITELVMARDELRKRHEDSVAQLQANSEQLTALDLELKAARAERGRIERAAAELKTSLSAQVETLVATRDALQGRLDESNGLLNAGAQRLAALDLELKAARGERERIERAAAEQQTQLSGQIDTLTATRNELQARVDDANAQLNAGALRLAALESELRAAHADRERVERAAAEQQTQLNGQIDALVTARDELQRRVDDVDAQLIAGAQRLAALDNELRAAHAERAKVERDAAERQLALTKALQSERRSAKELSLKLTGMIARERRYKEQLVQSEARQKAEAKRLVALDSELQVARAEHVQAGRLAAAQQRALADALAEERSAASRLDVKWKGLAAREQRYREQIAELEETARKVRHLDQRVRRAEREKASAEKRAEDAKKTLSFQLGYAIIQATKSWRGLFQLPSALIQVRREARLRREKKTLKSGRPLPLARQETVEQAQAVIQMAEDFKVSVPAQQSKLRVAAVMDEFTFHSYNPECELLQLHPDTCVQQLIEFKPDVLFIESAWKGLEGLWQLKISNNGPEINACIQWCKANKVPTMFWNKEDPVHFSTFVPLAQQVDYVFTTDIDCIPRYKHAVGHDRVFLLPFAAQPKTHNPIELFERKDAFNFAGSYYLRYPERQRDFAVLIDTVKAFKPVEIYDRNFDNPHPNYTFPDSYKPMILGRLPFEEIDKAYKGYRYGINMNTIKQSQTMFARRVFELLASNTVVVSNFSRGVRMLFGDLVITSDDTTQLHRGLERICQDETAYRRLRLMGLRKVMLEHTYAHRLAYIRAKLSGEGYRPQLTPVAVLAVARSVEEQTRLLAHFRRQSYPACALYLLQAFDGPKTPDEANIHVFTDEMACRQALGVGLQTTPLLAVFVAQDHYGPEYLTDLALATSYSQASAFGKATHYVAEGEGVRLTQDGRQYRPAELLQARAAVVRSASLTSGWLSACLSQPASASLQLRDMLATDEFHYCREGAALRETALREALEDLPLANRGASFAHSLALTAESLQADAGPESNDDGLPQVGAEMLFKLIPKPASKQLQLSFKEGALQLRSTLPAEKHGYLYANKRFTRKELNLVLNSQFRLDAEHTIPDLKTIFEFQDAQGQKISHAMNGSVGGKHALAIPNHCTHIRFGLRVQGPGNATIQRLVLGNHGERPAAIAGQTPYLVLTKQYPAYDDLYRYGFLHSRVRGYKAHGLLVDVFRISNEPGQVYREFEGIDVASGDAQLLDDTLTTGRYKHVLVHMLDENMWRVLERHLDHVQVTVWVHGAEIQVWQRRAFEFVSMSPEEVTRQKKLSDKRVKFWQKILKTPHRNLHLVFVSNYLRNEAITDLKVELPDTVASVVGNFIDGDTFPYREKKAEDRLQLLSIRPYAKRVYANDLTVAAIVELSKRPFFKELSFTLVGDGDLFDDTVAPLRGFDNVKLEKRFLTHAEIAQYHQRHGVLIVPTRMDTQGVSRDEAMSSGLVPITTNVAAIPEFVNDACGIVVPPEDYKAMADGVEFLYRNPAKFLELSKAASQRVRQQSDFHQTLEKEIQLIRQKMP